jgi:hypothetical protein
MLEDLLLDDHIILLKFACYIEDQLLFLVIILIVITSSAANGSSKRSIFGSDIKAKAITNFFFDHLIRSFAFKSLNGSNSNFEIKEFIFSTL